MAEFCKSRPNLTLREVKAGFLIVGGVEWEGANMKPSC